MPRVRFTPHLRKFFPDLHNGDSIDAPTVAALLDALEQRYPGFAAYIVDERGRLRQHVNIFVGQQLIVDREHLQDALTPQDEVYIMQALSGGTA
jgi:molybdopterin synthase sulfur carrier subunit